MPIVLGFSYHTATVWEIGWAIIHREWYSWPIPSDSPPPVLSPPKMSHHILNQHLQLRFHAPSTWVRFCIQCTAHICLITRPRQCHRPHDDGRGESTNLRRFNFHCFLSYVVRYSHKSPLTWQPEHELSKVNNRHPKVYGGSPWSFNCPWRSTEMLRVG